MSARSNPVFSLLVRPHVLLGSALYSPAMYLRLSLPLLCFRSRVTLSDREPGPDERRLGSAGALKLAPPSPALKGLATLVSEFMPAVVIHDVYISQENLNDDYAALELLYYTDAYEYLLDTHFNSKGVYHSKTMRFVSRFAKGAHRSLVLLWNARFMSA